MLLHLRRMFRLHRFGPAGKALGLRAFETSEGHEGRETTWLQSANHLAPVRMVLSVPWTQVSSALSSPCADVNLLDVGG